MISPRLRTAAIGRWLARLGVGLLCLAAATWGYFETAHGRATLRAALSDGLRTQLGLETQLADVRLVPTLLPPGLSLVARGISLAHPTEGRLAVASRLEVRPSFTRLLRGELELTRIVLERPTVRLVVRDGALVNGPTLPTSSGGSTDLPFRYLAIADGTVRVVTDLGVGGTVRGLDVEVLARTPRALSVDLRIEGGVLAHPRGEEALHGVVVEGAVDLDRGATITRAELSTASVRLALRDAEVPLPFDDTARTRFALEVDITRLATTFAEDLGVSIEGRLVARGGVALDHGRLRGDARLVLLSPAVRGRGFGEPLELDVRFDEHALEIVRGVMHVPHDGGTVGLTARVGLETPFPVRASLDFRGMELAALLADLGITPNAIAQWTFDGPAELSGALVPFGLTGTIDVETHDFFVSQGPWHRLPLERIIGVGRGHLRGRVAIDETALSFLDLDVVTDHSRLDCDTVISFSDWFRVRAHSTQFDLLDISPLTTFALTGAGSLDVEVGGQYADPQLDATAFLRGFSFDGMPLGDVELSAEFEQGGLVAHFPTIRAVHGDSRYVVRDLRLDFTEHFAIDADVDVETMTFEDFYRTFHLDEDERFDPFVGVGRGQVHAHFTHGFPGDGPTGTLHTRIDVELPSTTLSGYAFEDGRFRGAVRWYDFDRGFDGAEVDVDEFTLRKGGATVSVAGTIAQDGVLDLSLVADRMAIEETEGLRESFPLLTGEYGLLGTVSNTLAVPHVDLDLRVSNVAWAGRPVGDGRAYVKLTDVHDPWVQAVADVDPDAPSAPPCVRARRGLAHADWQADPPLRTPEGLVPALDRPQAFLVCGGGLGGALDFDVALGWTQASPHRGRIVLRDLDLSPLLPEGDDGAASRGRITATIDLDDGDLLTDRSTTGRVHVESLDLSASGVAVRAGAPFDVTIDRGTAKFNGARIAGNGTELSVFGTMSATELALSLEGSVGIELFAAASPALSSATGSTDLRLLVRGPIADPEVVGEATFSGVGVEHASLPVPISDLAGRIEFSQRRVLVERITGRVGDGHVTLTGSAAIDGGAPSAFEARAVLDRVAFRPEEGLEVALGGELVATWDTSRELPLLSGRVNLERVRYTRPISVTPTLGELQRPTRAAVDDYDPDDEFVELDLVVTQERPIEIRNELVDFDVRIESGERPFRVVGTNERPAVLGTLTIPRGQLFFRGTAFEVRRGSVELDDPQRIHPRFDLVATTDIRRAYDSTAPSYRVQLEARGDSDGFRLDASSTPSLSQQDIMLLLMIGMTSSELQNLETSQLSTTALDAISSLSGVEDRISDAVRVIDEVSLTTTYHPVTNRPEPQLTVGTRITDRVRVTASTGLTAESRSVRTTAQFRIDDHTSLQAVYDNINRETASAFGNVGVDVRYRLEFE